ncbi:MAG: hypothetical protein ACLPID_10660 [Beijerinckiaceae bacterium]
MDKRVEADEASSQPGESQHERFRRLAGKRVVRTIKDIRLIGNLGNRNNYEYTNGEIDKIFRALDRELKQARVKFDGRRKEDDGIDFSL